MGGVVYGCASAALCRSVCLSAADAYVFRALSYGRHWFPLIPHRRSSIPGIFQPSSSRADTIRVSAVSTLPLLRLTVHAPAVLPSASFDVRIWTVDDPGVRVNDSARVVSRLLFRIGPELFGSYGDLSLTFPVSVERLPFTGDANLPILYALVRGSFPLRSLLTHCAAAVP